MLQSISRLSNILNVDLRLMRDDLYPFYGGGNKARKMAYILRKAQENGANALVTAGEIHSNHARVVALIGAEMGWKVVIVIHDAPEPLPRKSGNFLLVSLSGAEIVYCNKSEVGYAMDEQMKRLADQGLKPFYIYGGGHCLEGTLAYRDAVIELSAQLQQEKWEPDYIVLASGMGGTQAGIHLGCAELGIRTEVIGISISRDKFRGTKAVEDSIDELALHLGLNTNGIPPVQFRDEWVGNHYASVYPELTDLIKWTLKTSGLIIDPVYTGKAFYGLVQLIKRNEIREGSRSFVLAHWRLVESSFVTILRIWNCIVPNVLLTCAGRRNYIVDYFREALAGDGKVFTANSTYDATAMMVSDGAFIAPPLFDKDYIPYLLRLCERYSIRLVVPLFDIELPLLAASRSRFEEIGVVVAVSDTTVVEICNDKWNTYTFLKDNDFSIARAFLDIEELIEAVRVGDARFPFAIKPRWGMGSIATFKAYNERELIVFYDAVLRELKNTYLKYESSQDIKRAVFIQEWIEGDEFNIDSVNDFSGRHITTLIVRKMAMRAGETDAAETIEHSEIAQIGERLSTLLKHRGVMDIDLIWLQGKGYVIDLNARIGGAYPFSHIAGANLPAAYIAWALGQEARPEWLKIKYGVRGFKALELIVQDFKNIINVGQCRTD